jgi:hypothetical protein
VLGYHGYETKTKDIIVVVLFSYVNKYMYNMFYDIAVTMRLPARAFSRKNVIYAGEIAGDIVVCEYEPYIYMYVCNGDTICELFILGYVSVLNSAEYCFRNDIVFRRRLSSWISMRD